MMFKIKNCAYLFLFILAGSALSFSLYSGTPAAPDKALQSGDKVPDFHLNNDVGELWSFNKHVGDEPLVVYFYPAAMTRGCTKQACAYRDDKSSLRKQDVRVVGISGDAVRNLQHFRTEYNLNFTLLSDPDGSVAQKFGVPAKEGGTIERSVKGEQRTLVRGATFDRWTFVIDRDGEVAYVNRDVTPEEDSENVLSVIRELNSD